MGRASTAVAAALAALSCGGNQSGCGGNQSGAVTSAGAPTAVIASTAATGGAGGAGGAAGAGGAGGSRPPLLPLAIGNRWTYRLKVVGMGGLCSGGVFSSTVAASMPLDGKTAYQLTPWCDSVSQPIFLSPGAGDEVFSHDQSGWEVMLDGDVSDGHAWTFAGSPFSWKREGAVNVPAGTFSDCWSQVETDQAAIYDTYCRGVGAVRHHAELGGDGYDAQLIAVK